MTRNILSALLAFLLAAALMACSLLALGARVPGRAQDFLVSAGEATLTAQKARVDEAIRQQADLYGFDAAAIQALADTETLRGLNREAAAWTAGLLTGDFEGDEPYFTLDGLEDAIVNDPGFRETVEPALWQSTARDEASAAVEKALKGTVLPVRSSLLAMARVKAADYVDVPALLARLPRYTLYAGLAAAALALLIFLVNLRRVRLALIWLGAALAASGLMLLAVWLVIGLLRLPAQAAQVSEIGGLLCSRLLDALRPWLLALPLAAVIAGEGVVLACILCKRGERNA